MSSPLSLRIDGIYPEFSRRRLLHRFPRKRKQDTKKDSQTLQLQPQLEICKNLFSRKLEEIPKNEICLYCFETEKRRKSLRQKWGDKFINNKMETIAESMANFKEKHCEIMNINLEFQKTHNTWYIPIAQHENSTLNRIFNLPKIIVSLEPGFEDYHKMAIFIASGIHFFHINLSKGSRETQVKTLKFINKIKKANPRYMIIIMVQISNSSIRVGDLRHDSTGVYIERDTKFVLTTALGFYSQGSHEMVYCNLQDYIDYLDLNTRILIGPKIQLEVISIVNRNVGCIVRRGGLLTPRMEARVLGKMDFLQENISNDEEMDIKLAVHYNCSYLVCPRADKIKLCQYIKWIAASENKSVFVVGKLYPNVNTYTVVQRIFKEYNGIWIRDRETPMPADLEELVYMQSKLRQMPIVRDGTFIKSMHVKLPSLDVKKYHLLFPQCLVFLESGPLNVIEVPQIIMKNYPDMNRDLLELCCRQPISKKVMPNLLARQVAFEVLFRNIACVICICVTGAFTQSLASSNILVPIICIADHRTTAIRLLLWRNVSVLLYKTSESKPWLEELDLRLRVCLKYCRKHEILVDGLSFIVTFPSKPDLLLSDTFRILKLIEGGCDLFK